MNQVGLEHKQSVDISVKKLNSLKQILKEFRVRENHTNSLY